MSWLMLIRRFQRETHLFTERRWGRFRWGVPVDFSSRISHRKRFRRKNWTIVKRIERVYAFQFEEIACFTVQVRSTTYSLCPIILACTQVSHHFESTFADRLATIFIRTTVALLGERERCELSPATASDNWWRPTTTPTRTLHRLVN